MISSARHCPKCWEHFLEEVYELGLWVAFFLGVIYLYAVIGKFLFKILS
ncbi:hypothetical protein [Candidatus Manganitrophus noduliformans]|nr:hypothetical protein [Candidatus Manganitrophus noduliformans]